MPAVLLQKNCPWYYCNNSWEETQDIPWDKKKNEPVTPGLYVPSESHGGVIVVRMWVCV